jgi:hypothetical protein
LIQARVVDQEGTPFGRYRLIELLGRGGMGDVWRPFDTETQRVVAVKVLPPNLVDDPAFVERFRREALAATTAGCATAAEWGRIEHRRDAVPAIRSTDGRF